MNKKKTETKLKNLEGMKAGIEGILAQAWERGYKYGLFEAEQKHQVKVLIGGEQVYPEQETNNQNKCPSFDEVWEELEHEEGGEIFVKARKIADELTKSIEMEHDKKVEKGMTLDEAIKHCEEKAKELRHKVETWVHCPDDPNWRKDLKDFDDCKECAEEHEQLAEWLKELKARREEE